MSLSIDLLRRSNMWDETQRVEHIMTFGIGNLAHESDGVHEAGVGDDAALLREVDPVAGYFGHDFTAFRYGARHDPHLAYVILVIFVDVNSIVPAIVGFFGLRESHRPVFTISAL